MFYRYKLRSKHSQNYALSLYTPYLFSVSVLRCISDSRALDILDKILGSLLLYYLEALNSSSVAAFVIGRFFGGWKKRANQ